MGICLPGKNKVICCYNLAGEMCFSQAERWRGSFTHLPATTTHAKATLSKCWCDKMSVCAVQGKSRCYVDRVVG
jgi:hypothetical protein